MLGVEEIRAYSGNLETELLAIVVRAAAKGNAFLTQYDDPLQLGLQERGADVEPHYHNWVKRELHRTHEFVLVRSGRVALDLYDSRHALFTTRELGPGDSVLLCEGGHGFRVLEKCELLEVKQGPYLGSMDKTEVQRGRVPAAGEGA